MVKQDEGSGPGTKSCFVISPIGEESSPARIRSDKVFQHVIKPVCDACGYAPLRSDIEPTPGMIGHQIVSHLLRDDLVIADLTGLNANVFYELAIRHMVRKPVVQIIQKGEALPFDITQSRTIFLDHTDLDSAEACREEMIRQIRELERDPSMVENPVSQAIRIDELHQRDDPKDQRDADILAHLNRISWQVEMLLLDRQRRNGMHPDQLAANGASPDDRAPGSALAKILDSSVTLDQAIRALQLQRGREPDADTDPPHVTVPNRTEEP